MKSVLITGASGGFGMEAAVEFARLGWRVIATVRNPASAIPLRERVGEAGASERLEVLTLDVTDPASIAAAMRDCIRITNGSLDALLNNAGFGTLGFFEDLSDAECRSVLETNLLGAIALTRAVVPLMRQARSGRIAFVSSNAVCAPHPTMTMYAASKWAIEGFAEALSMELAPFNVHVLVLRPGNHRTPFASHVQFRRSESSAYARVWDALLPGLTQLGERGRDQSHATPIIVRALTEPNPRFLYLIGPDVWLFSALKRFTSYEFRAWAVRHFVGFPGRKGQGAQTDESLLRSKT